MFVESSTKKGFPLRQERNIRSMEVLNTNDLSGRNRDLFDPLEEISFVIFHLEPIK